jgi:ABC-type nitrate/sulfonate/bicarbonate transport system substrate-binding protein
VDLGINDRSMEALQAGELDAALLPPEKAFGAQAQGFRVVADSLDLSCHWVPLATTREFLENNRDLVAKVASVYRDSIGIFTREPQFALEEIARHLPGLQRNREVLERCYRVFAGIFEPTLTPSLSSLAEILQEVALQDPRAQDLTPASLVQTVL